jgi:hypothetical protein
MIASGPNETKQNSKNDLDTKLVERVSIRVYIVRGEKQ